MCLQWRQQDVTLEKHNLTLTFFEKPLLWNFSKVLFRHHVTPSQPLRRSSCSHFCSHFCILLPSVTPASRFMPLALLMANIELTSLLRWLSAQSLWLTPVFYLVDPQLRERSECCSATAACEKRSEEESSADQDGSSNWPVSALSVYVSATVRWRIRNTISFLGQVCARRNLIDNNVGLSGGVK